MNMHQYIKLFCRQLSVLGLKTNLKLIVIYCFEIELHFIFQCCTDRCLINDEYLLQMEIVRTWNT